MKSILFEIASFVSHFDGFEFMYQSGMYVVHIFCVCFSSFLITLYLGFIYGIKKSEKKDKYIRKEYNIFQRILLIHWYQNIYKKVDRFWFDIIYRYYLVNLALFVLVMLLCLLCHYFDFLNMIAGILYVVHCVYMAAVGIVYFLGTKHSPTGGVELRCAKKYSGKKWR